jgi:dTDP-4-amino-4,6-dideoxygalactose transaminase
VTDRIYLSPPHMSGRERALLLDAYDSNWIAPLGPHVDGFESALARYTGVPHFAALSSGTAAIHLALQILGVGRGDSVFVSSFTFAASANPIVYLGAEPVFIDSDAATWNMDPQLLREELRRASRNNTLPKAAIIVDLYGQCADYDPILAACAEYGVPVIEDAAEALGATYKGKAAGNFGELAVFSFNGNKIITTSGGGALASGNPELIRRARFLATQARDAAPHYEHSSIGFNYRLSNVLAAIGRGQLETIEDRVAARRRNFDMYRDAIGDLPGVEFMPEAPYGRANRWLTCITVNPDEFGASREDVRLALERENIEARPTWKPMHMQPVFSECRAVGGAVSARIFERGLCLPSGSSLTDADLARVSNVIRQTCAAQRV